MFVIMRGELEDGKRREENEREEKGWVEIERIKGL